MNPAYLEVAWQIGAKLARNAVWDKNRCNWVGPLFEEFGGRQQLGMGTLGPTVYEGTAGIGLFLSDLYRCTNDRVIGATAKAAMEHALDRVSDVRAALELGLYTGAFGVGYSAVEAGFRLQTESLIERGMALVRRVLALDAEGKSALDVMSGRAGMVPALLRLGQLAAGEDLLDAAIAGGDFLLERATRNPRGLSWDTMGEMGRVIDFAAVSPELAATISTGDQPHLGGLSHGAGGMGWALAELAAATGEKRFREAAHLAFAYEDSYFDTVNDGWPDLRRPEGEVPARMPASWCHGAVGIGLVRVRALALFGERSLWESARNALRVSAKAVLQRVLSRQANFSLCHGLAGDAELFIGWHKLTGDPEARQIVDLIAQYGIDAYQTERRPWPSGIEGAVESPGLMLGTAGTGYFYLRAAAPEAQSALLITPSTPIFKSAARQEAVTPAGES